VNSVNGERVLVYVAIAAQAKTDKRQQNSAHNKHPLKNPDVYAYVTSYLRKGWSPEEISGRLRKVDHPSNPHWHISHETIYSWIYTQPKNENGLYWYEYLRRKQKKRKKQKGRKVHKSHIPDRVSIHERSTVANNRTEFGHWEGDSVEGLRSTKAGLHTEVERMSRLIKATKVANLTSEEALRAQLSIFSNEPAKAVKSTTIDNGKETHLHYLLRDLLHMATYHADPYSSWQRGTNENGNGLIRCYYPKKTDFTTVSEEELQAVVAEINSRPRKIHNYLTANEVYYKLLKDT
jgi:IS30 family transposase